MNWRLFVRKCEIWPTKWVRDKTRAIAKGSLGNRDNDLVIGSLGMIDKSNEAMKCPLDKTGETRICIIGSSIDSDWLTDTKSDLDTTCILEAKLLSQKKILNNPCWEENK